MRRAVVVACMIGTAGACSTFSEGNDGTPFVDAGSSEGGENDAAQATDGGAGPQAPCSNAICAEIIATDQAKANEVFVDDQRVYWTIDDDNGTVMAREHAAGSLPYRVVSNSVRPRSMIGSGGVLYFGAAESVHLIERDAKNGGLSLAAQAAANPVTSVARGGGKLFATSGMVMQSCDLMGGAICKDFVLTSTTDVGPGARALAVDAVGTRIYFATDTSIWRQDVSSDSPQEWWGLTKVHAIVADETSVFVARQGERGLAKFGRDDGRLVPLNVIAAGAPVPWALVVDGSDIFYTAIDDNLVVKLSKDGTSAKIIAANVDHPKGIAVRLDKVYVALGDGRIVALPRN